MNLPLEFTEVLLLSVTAFFTSMFSAITGMGGGIILVVVMGSFLPPAVLIPIHGIVQLISNSTRGYFNRHFVKWSMVKIYAAGAFFGMVPAVLIVKQTPTDVYRVILAVFILLMTWLPGLYQLTKIRGHFFWLGSLASFLSFFVGAIGPLIAPFFLHSGLNKRELVGTKALCQAVVHILKTIAFVGLGFSFRHYGMLILILIAAVILGTKLGTLLLGKVPEKAFRSLFKYLITVLALRILYIAFS